MRENSAFILIYFQSSDDGDDDDDDGKNNEKKGQNIETVTEHRNSDKETLSRLIQHTWDTMDLFYPYAAGRLIQQAWDAVDLY